MDTHTPVLNIITKAFMACVLIQKLMGPGSDVKFHQPENKMSCLRRKNFFCFWVVQKSSGVGCSGLKYHVLGSKMVVGDQSSLS